MSIAFDELSIRRIRAVIRADMDREPTPAEVFHELVAIAEPKPVKPFVSMAPIGLDPAEVALIEFERRRRDMLREALL